MYAESRAVGKQEQCNKASWPKICRFDAVPAGFCRALFGAEDAPPALDLYDHIILVDGTRGECYGRIKSYR
jgi:hypothetical protein